MKIETFAFDKKPENRTKDVDGRLHIASSNISKATVNPYKGEEIPDWEKLGLDPQKIYQLLRHPDELKKAAPTFNKIQLLRRHIAVSADDPKKDDVVGTTGENARFEDPYLINSLAVWDAEAIAGIESEEQEQLSCSYRYVADMTPGEYQGLRFDGVMRDIVANHVALVSAGRAGADVVVGDQALDRRPMALTSRKALLVRGALAAYVTPKLASGQRLAFDSILGDVNRANYRAKKPAILAAIKPRLAADADMEDIHKLLDSLDDENDGAEDEDDMDADDEEPDDEREEREDAEDAAGYMKMGAKDRKAWDAAWAKDRPARDAKRGRDSEPGGEKKEGAMDKKAMDAAIETAVKAATTTAIARVNAIRDAEREVRPFVGDIVVAMDSADAVRKFALETLGVNVEGVHPSAYSAILALQPKPDGRRTQTPKFAHDAAMAANELFPDAARIGQA
jgi:hypothetical protein